MSAIQTHSSFKASLPNQSFQAFLALVGKNKQNKNRTYNESYKSKHIRKRLIRKTLVPICNYLKFSSKTLHKAIGLLDCLTSRYLVDDKVFVRMGLICLSLASKVTESQKQVLLNNSLHLILENPEQDYPMLEKNALLCLNFDVNVLTPHDVLEELLKLPPIYEGLSYNVKKRFKKFIMKLDLLCAQDYEMNQFKALAVALSIIKVARSTFGCESGVPSKIVGLTNYTEELLDLAFVSVSKISVKLIQKLPIANQSFSSDTTQESLSN